MMQNGANRRVIQDANHAIFTVNKRPGDASAAEATSVTSPARSVDAVNKGPVNSFEASKAQSEAPRKTVFARMNESWFTKDSTKTHEFFQKNPTDWNAYHATFREARKTWGATPADEMIRFYSEHPSVVIGDFGCGEGMIGAALASKHKVHSFDHIAVDPSITACDIANVPLDNQTLDVAIFSLALMGKNFTQYIDEAHRVLKVGGRMHILEMTRRFTDREGFVKGLEAKGFKVESVVDMWRFTHVMAVKTAAELGSADQLVF